MSVLIIIVFFVIIALGFCIGAFLMRNKKQLADLQEQLADLQSDDIVGIDLHGPSEFELFNTDTIRLHDTDVVAVPGKYYQNDRQVLQLLQVIGFELNFSIGAVDSITIKYAQKGDGIALYDRKTLAPKKFISKDGVSSTITKPYLIEKFGRRIAARKWEDIVLIMKDGTRRVVKGTEFRYASGIFQ